MTEQYDIIFTIKDTDGKEKKPSHPECFKERLPVIVYWIFTQKHDR